MEYLGLQAKDSTKKFQKLHLEDSCGWHHNAIIPTKKWCAWKTGAKGSLPVRDLMEISLLLNCGW